MSVSYEVDIVFKNKENFSSLHNGHIQILCLNFMYLTTISLSLGVKRCSTKLKSWYLKLYSGAHYDIDIYLWSVIISDQKTNFHQEDSIDFQQVVKRKIFYVTYFLRFSSISPKILLIVFEKSHVEMLLGRVYERDLVTINKNEQSQRMKWGWNSQKEDLIWLFITLYYWKQDFGLDVKKSFFVITMQMLIS